MWGANAWATVPWAVASATTATAPGTVTLTTTGQNTLVLSAVKIGSVAITEGQ